MPRIHLFEFEDQPWFPSRIRDAGTAYLRFVATLSGQARLLAPKLREALEASGETRIVDLCSGGAGPIPAVVEALAAEGIEVTATLTDRYPNAASFEHVSARSSGRIGFRAESLDATRVPHELPGLRTLFSALHHFKPDAARAILQSAVDSGQPIAAIESVSRHPAAIVGILFAPLAVCVALPFLRPFHWSWLLFTYLIPVIPLFVLWDGLVSCLRVYSIAELGDLVRGLEGGERFDWDIGHIALPPVPAPAIYCIGTPRS